MDTVALGTAKLSAPTHTHGPLTERVKSMQNQITIQLCQWHVTTPSVEFKHATVGSALLAKVSGCYVGDTDELHATIPMQRYQFILSQVHLDGLVKGSRVLYLAEYAVGSAVSWRLPEGQMDDMFNRHENQESQYCLSNPINFSRLINSGLNKLPFGVIYSIALLP